QDRFQRRPLELSPLPGQCFSPVAARRRLQPGQLLSSLSAAALALSPDRNSARPVVQTRRSHTPDRPLRSLSPRHRLALSEPVPFRRARRQQQLTRFLTSEPDSPQAVSAEPCAKSPALCSRSSFVSHPPLRPLDSAIPRHPDHTFRSSDELSRLAASQRFCSALFRINVWALDVPASDMHYIM